MSSASDKLAMIVVVVPVAVAAVVSINKMY